MSAEPETAATVKDAPGDDSRIDTPDRFASYRIRELLGTGGMGEVLLADDVRFGRQVALKRIRVATPSDALVARFLREAKIQARLDHPAIVPVHDIGRDPQGRPFFTMKRISGVTLAARMRESETVRVPLLRALVDACRAVELAHARGVVHRDLKPSNIMLGAYGEVHVLDWGVAYLPADAEIASEPEPGEMLETSAGTVVGTTEYMAPEQARGERVTPAADVFSLGAILFEILAGRRLVERGGTTTDPALVRAPATQRPDAAIPPELDALCTRALAPAASDRPTARAFGDALQQYLDGDRDIALRATIAAAHLDEARGHLSSLDPERRGAAMSAAGRALALTPESREATEVVGTLLLEPPGRMPPQLEERLERRLLDDSMEQGRTASRALLVYLAFVPLALWSGVTSWPTVATFVIVAAGLSAFAYVQAGKRLRHIALAVLGNAIIVGLSSRFLGPFVVGPGLAAAVAIMLLVFPAIGRHRWYVLGPLLAGFVGPLALEAAGVLQQTWSLEGGALVLRPSAIVLDGPGAVGLLIATNVALVVVMGILASRFGAAARETRRQLEVWSWHLEQLLPSSIVPRAAAATSRASSAT